MKLKSFSELADLRAGNHADIASGLAAIKAWAARPEVSGVGTNWRVVADNDNPRPPEFNIEASHEILPSEPEIMRAIAGVQTTSALEARFEGKPSHWARRFVELGLDGRKPTRSVVRLVSGDFDRDRKGRVIRIGKLRFANGDPDTEVADYEIAHVREDGPRAKAKEVRARAGTLMGQRVKAMSKGVAAPTVSNAVIAEFIGSDVPVHRKLTKRPHTAATALTKAQAREALEAAGVKSSMSFAEVREAVGLPPADREAEAVLPVGAATVGDIFFSRLRAFAARSSGSCSDPHDAMMRAARWVAAERSLDHTTRETLGCLQNAGNVADLGGGSRRKGKGALIAANDNLAAAIKKFVA